MKKKNKWQENALLMPNKNYCETQCNWVHPPPPPPPPPHQKLLGYFWWEFEELVNRFLFNFSHFVVYFIAHRENIWFVERG